MENKVFLNRYRLSLGRNGLPVELHRSPNGITYRAQEIDSGREVAIELIPWVAPDESAAAQTRERAAAARQINHINIPALHDFGIEDDQLVYVTDYFEGYTAEAWIGARGPLTTDAVLRIALQVAGALGAASFHRIQHRAINPANIIFVPGQTAEGDWPAIKVLHWLGPEVAATKESDARSDTAARFASPEQLRGAPVDFSSAIFSLGCTMWFLLTGVPPAAPGAKGVRAGVAKLRGVPKIVRHLLGRMLRVDPAERPQDPVVLQAYLQTCLARVERREAMSRRLGLPLTVRPRATETRRARNFPMKQLALAALLLLCATVAVFALPRFLRSRPVAQASATTKNTAITTPAPLLSSTAPGDLPNDVETEPETPAEGPDEVVTAPAASSSAVAQNLAATPAQASVGPVARKELPAVASNSSAAAPVTVAPESPSPAVGGPTTEIATTKVSPNEQPSVAPASRKELPAVASNSPAAVPVTVPPESPSPAVGSSSGPATEVATTKVSPNEQPSVTPVSRKEFPVLASNSPAPAPAPVEAENLTPEVAAESPAPTIAEPSASPTAAPRSKKAKTEVAKSSEKKSRSRAIAAARKSRTRLLKKPRMAHAEVRRGRKIPSLHVGTSRAELVGTTADGRWILSVASSGERIIVPPPPGFDR